MQIVDAHLDIAWNALALQRDPLLPVAESRRREAGSRLAEREGAVSVSLPQMQAAGASIIFGTLFVLPEHAHSTIEGLAYATPQQARQQALAQIDYYRGLAQSGAIQLVTNRSELQLALARDALGLVLLMEGADPILSPGELEQWHAAGLRIVGPAWQATRYSGGSGAPGPLTPLGRELLLEMERQALPLDLSHMAEESFWEALELFHGPVLASHSNCRALVPTDRHLSDAMIEAIVARDGVIGVLPYNDFLVAHWDRRKESVGLDALLRHIDRICAIAGDTRHVGIGSDLDGGFGREGIPRELDSWADLPQLAELLAASGWADADIALLLGGNWLRWLERALPQ